MQKGTLALRCVLPGVAAIRRWDNRLHSCQKPEAEERHWDGKGCSCCFQSIRVIHWDSFLPSLRGFCDYRSGRGEEPSGEAPPPDSDLFNDIVYSLNW